MATAKTWIGAAAEIPWPRCGPALACLAVAAAIALWARRRPPTPGDGPLI